MQLSVPVREWPGNFVLLGLHKWAVHRGPRGRDTGLTPSGDSPLVSRKLSKKAECQGGQALFIGVLKMFGFDCKIDFTVVCYTGKSMI